MLAYAQDAQESDTPWVNWEFQNQGLEGWRKCTNHPEWKTYHNYRRAIKTIRIGEYDVPEPLRVKPNIKDTYYFVSFREGDSVDIFTWANDSIDNRLLSNGVVHLTREAAELHAEALISLTKL
jgi:hypothetical protein